MIKLNDGSQASRAVLAGIASALDLPVSVNRYDTLQLAIDAAIASNLPRLILPPGDYTLPSEGLTLSASISIEGDQQCASEYAVRLLCPGNGILAERSSGADNIVGVHLKNLRIEKTGTSKTPGSYGVKLVGANSNIVCENVEVRHFEKNWWLRGVIGAQFKNISGRGGKYGLFTESHAALSYDCTNSDFFGCKFTDANEVGVYLGPLTQGFNFFGGDIERNDLGVEFANTAPASSNVNFFGTWFEANTLHWEFTQKPLAVQFDGCYVYGGTLWSNDASGTIGASVRNCRLTNSVAVDMDIFNGNWEDNSDDGTLSITATAPNGYYFRKLRGTAFTIDGKTLQNVENIGAGRYVIYAIGTPASSGFVIGSEWADTNAGKRHIHNGTVWKEVAFV